MKFTIRDLFLVTMIVALGLGWWANSRTMEENRREVVTHAKELRNSLGDAKRLSAQLERDAGPLKHAIPKQTVDWSILDKPIPNP
jgi:hypothetical protein